MSKLAVTKVELYLLKEMFSAIDADGNGVIDKEEMTKLFKKVFTNEDDESIKNSVDDCFTLYDEDQNGVVDFEEYCKGLGSALLEIGKEAPSEGKEQKEDGKKSIDM